MDERGSAPKALASSTVALRVSGDIRVERKRYLPLKLTPFWDFFAGFLSEKLVVCIPQSTEKYVVLDRKE